MVMCILESAFKHYKVSNPEIETLHLKTDNAGCYKNQLIVMGLYAMFTKIDGLEIKTFINNGPFAVMFTHQS